MKVYEYNEIIDSLLNTDSDGVDKETGVVFDLTLLDSLEMERNEKIENLLLYAAQLESDAGEIDAYAKTLAARAKAKKNKADKLREWLCSEITRYGEKRFESKRIKGVVSYRASVDVPDITLLPKEFIREKTEISADKTAIAAAIKAGDVVPGASLVEKPSIRIS